MNSSSILKDLFTIQNVTENDSIILADVSINGDNDIYKAHFPGDPITPGVCQMHLVKDIISIAYPNKTLSLSHSKQIKFTEVLRPTEYLEVKAKITVVNNDEELTVNAQIFNAEKVFFKAKLTFNCGA